jgi:hypothetical protein
MVKVGDDVFWNSPNGTTHGTIVKKLVRESKIGGHTVDASPSTPQYEVESDKTGKHAAHKPSALHKK